MLKLKYNIIKEKKNLISLFSYHEIGTRDLPAMIDYVLNYTKQKTLYYIGHSMGTTILFTLLSMRPEYNAKIKLGICLAPVAIWKEIPSFLENIRRKISNILVKRYQNHILRKMKIYFI